MLVGDGLAGGPVRGAVRPHHGHGGGRSIPEALVAQLAEGGVMILPLGPHGGVAGTGQADQDARAGCNARDLIAVRFVPLLPGQARANCNAFCSIR